MKYILSYKNPHQHFLDIEFITSCNKKDTVHLQLPSWRPGRYELGNFAKNIQKFSVTDENNRPLLFRKVKKDLWEIDTKGVGVIHVKYNYYAAELNAGSTFLDGQQLYVNPVNCFLYNVGDINSSCTVELNIPEEYKVACALKQEISGEKTKGKHCVKLLADNYHTLADSPFVASSGLKHHQFIVDDILFHLWFQGECKPDFKKLEADFIPFIQDQLQMMKDFPVNEFHFIFQILPYKCYHGVEHLSSTILLLGPSYAIMNNATYVDLLGVSSHELFHVWNIKAIRPIEMYPYDYSKENYSKLGYVAEGNTTYYGDLVLYRCGVFKDELYFAELNMRIQKHMDNFGRFNLSVADSSFDTWLDGYVPGIPGRKTSIYDEGSIIAFITDYLIRRNTRNRNSLDDVMRYLYYEFYKHNKGYSEYDYIGVVNQVAETELKTFFEELVYKPASYEDELKNALNYFGLELLEKASPLFHESNWGIKLSESETGVLLVSSVWPFSAADKAGITKGDEVIALNSIHIKNNLNEWSRYFGNGTMNVLLKRNGEIITTSLEVTDESYFKVYNVAKKATATEDQKNNYMHWAKKTF